MKKDQKKMPLWKMIVFGAGVALMIYVIWVVLLAFFAVKGAVPEKMISSAIIISSALSVLIGGLYAIKKAGTGKRFVGILAAIVFGAVLVLVGLSSEPQDLSWTGNEGKILMAILAGGLLSVVLSAKKGRAGKRLRK